MAYPVASQKPVLAIFSNVCLLVASQSHDSMVNSTCNLTFNKIHNSNYWLHNMMHRTKMKWAIRFAIILISIWFLAMVCAPIISTKLNWIEIQTIWDRWQTLNSGMIALLAAMFAIYATQYIENTRRKRELIAAKALLPLALHDMSDHCCYLSNIINEEYKKLKEKHNTNISDYKIDRPGEWVFDTFKNCMTHEENDNAIFIASILSDIQILNARFYSFTDHKKIITSREINRMAENLCTLKSKIDRAFKYARGKDKLITTPITKSENENSSSALCLFENRDDVPS
ncbi:hypothetical protein J4G65_11875 [Aeromonas allosaccharophila]|uniref:hypothetical protein n=1 Tax=Aeromonas allosaccharophila TaxID=656 RepID=UPI001BCD1E26|nr:hypothetical protein [Aeromonas allosaccharophila]MBS4696165.1 hypothetical protein [Aeromonas allosaccharophila]